MTDRTEPERLIATCEALYGLRFQRELAESLDVNERTVRRWIAGTAPVPQGIWDQLALQMRERINVLTELVKACT